MVDWITITVEILMARALYIVTQTKITGVLVSLLKGYNFSPNAL